ETEINASTRKIDVRIRAEEGFNPQTDLDIKSLRFGSYNEVNFGRGCKVIKSKADGKDLIVTFNGKGSGITADEFAPKLIGKDAKGNMVFGYARLPYVDYKPAILSARRPRYNKENGTIEVEIQNYGLSAAKASEIEIIYDGNSIGKVAVNALKPYEKETARLSNINLSNDGKSRFEVVFLSDGKEVERNRF
ncbi:MAG: hypothetical protein IKU98_08820, partial [Bacteroidaceae bacterium]|nr:hypothetical protein [Bacteroidaceae bacterium]